MAAPFTRARLFHLVTGEREELAQPFRGLWGYASLAAAASFTRDWS